MDRGRRHDLASALLTAAREVHAEHAGGEPAAVIAALAGLLAEAHGRAAQFDIAADPAVVRELRRRLPERGSSLARLGADSLGPVYEGLLTDRRARGAYYTPPALVAALLDAVLDPVLDEAERARDPEAALLAITVCDPAVGAGNFVLAATRRIAGRLAAVRGDPAAATRDVAARCIFGVDVDPVAVALTRFGLGWLAGDTVDGAVGRIRTGDALLGVGPGFVGDRAVADEHCGADLRARHTFFHWPLEYADVFRDPRDGFSVVVGNPPFRSPLRDGAVVSPERRLIRVLAGGRGGPKADVSSYFLLLADRIAAPNGRVGLVLPDSILAAADSDDIRRHVANRRPVTHLWHGNGNEFTAGVTTIAIALGPRGTSAVPVRRSGERSGSIAARARSGWRSGRWAPLASDTTSRLVGRGESFGRWCRFAADYRDQYYGLRGAVEDAEVGYAFDAARPPLLTTGLVDVLRSHWGERGARFDRTGYIRPVVHRDRLSPKMQQWAEARLVPKLLVATQGTMPEVLPDPGGRYLPCVPMITGTPVDDRLDLDDLVAILLSPPVFDHLRAHGIGSGLSTSALKVSARNLRELPAPSDLGAVRAAAGLLPRLAAPKVAVEFETLTARAFGLTPEANPRWRTAIARQLGPPADHAGRPRPARSSRAAAGQRR